MIVKCPKCGQQLRGEPGTQGKCPKCQTQFIFPQGDRRYGEPIKCPHCGQMQVYKDGQCINCGNPLSMEEDSPIPLSISKKKGRKRLLLIPLLALCLIALVCAVVIAPVKFGSITGPLSLRMPQEEAMEVVNGENFDEEDGIISFQTKLPLFLFGPEVTCSASVSANNDRLYKISFIYFGTVKEVQTMYELLYHACKFKYGSSGEHEDLMGVFFSDYWKDGTNDISLSATAFDEETALVQLDIEDSLSYEATIIQDNDYSEFLGVPAYPGRILRDYIATDGSHVFLHKGSSAWGDKYDTIDQYDTSLYMDGFSRELRTEDKDFAMYESALWNVRVLVDEDSEDRVFVLISVK